MSLGERVNRALAHLFLQQHGAVIDPSRPQWGQASGGHSAQDSARRPPSGEFRPPADVWAERIERVVCRLEDAAGLGNKGKPRALTIHELRATLHDYEALEVAEVAFWTGRSTDDVARARQRSGRRINDGTRHERNERPLTASPHATLKALETE